MKARPAFGIVSALVVMSSLVTAIWLGSAQFQVTRESNLPIAPVREGEFEVVIRVRGEIRADRAAQVYAPVVPNLRIGWMAPPGELVEAGAPLIRFDSSTAEQQLIENRAALEQAEATLAQAIADGRITAEHDAADLADAHLDVELAELRTAGEEFVSRIAAEQARIDLRVAEQNVRTLEAEIAQHVVSNESHVAGLRRAVEAAEAELDLTQRRLAQMEIRAPLTGYTIFATNSTGLFQSTPQPYRVGDAVSGGMTLAQIPDLSSLLMDATVEETERGRLAVGDDVIIRVDALPERVIDAVLTGISPIAEFSLETFNSRFHVYAAIGGDADPRLRPGMNAGMDVVIERIPHAIAIPAPALFTRDGRPGVHLVEDEGYRWVEVEVLARNPDEVAVSGIPVDSRVALADPESALSGNEAAEGE